MIDTCNLRFDPGIEILMILPGCHDIVTSSCYVVFQRIQELLQGAFFKIKMLYLMMSKEKDP